MDIDLLSKMIKELILEHDRVCLPGLGTFVAETVPASFSDKGYTINPPYRKLSFRPVQENDGLLAGLYMSENSVSREVAMVAIDEFVSGMKEVLEKKKNVVFPGLGRLRATRENNFFFVSDEDLDIYPEGFGLGPVSLKSHVETKEELSAALGSLKEIIVQTQENDGSGHESVASGDSVPEESAAAAETPSEAGGSGSPAPAEPVAEDASMESPEENTVDKDVSVESPEKDAMYEDVSVESPEEDTMEDAVSGESQTAVAESAGCDEKDSAAGCENPVQRGKRGRVIRYILISAAVLVLLLAVYMIVARIFPDMMDTLLYDKEEYEILHNISLFQN